MSSTYYFISNKHRGQWWREICETTYEIVLEAMDDPVFRKKRHGLSLLKTNSAAFAESLREKAKVQK